MRAASQIVRALLPHDVSKNLTGCRVNRSSAVHAALAVTLAVAAGEPLVAQVRWTLESPSASPSGRWQSGLAYDSSRDRTVLFGGNNGFLLGILGETWEWNGSTWSLRSTSVSPSARSGHGMVYDSARQRVVLFGGQFPDRSDTWEWDGTNWLQRSPITSPAARSGHGMAYDSARQRVVVFGGSHSSTSLGDTWEYDGTNWTQSTPAASPPARFYPAMGYDADRGQVVLFGGTQGILADLQDTWVWDGTDWIPQLPFSRPSARYGAGMSFDRARSRIVLYGGSTLTSDTWEWTGNNWLQRSPTASPTGMSYPAMAYDSMREEIVLFWGATYVSVPARTWTYAPTHRATQTAFGAGCPSSVGTPTLTAVGRPWLGDTYTVQLDSIPSGPANLPIIVIGFSNTAWGGGALPYDLGPLGLSGCSLLVSPDAMQWPANVGGTASASLSLPDLPALLGATLYEQGGVLDPLANSGGIAVSNAVASIIGGR